MNFNDKLDIDYTLFNLHDEKTTQFYIDNIEYLVSNFPYFKNIDKISDYFTAGNASFNNAFKLHYKKFQDLIYYRINTEEGKLTKIIIENDPDDKQITYDESLAEINRCKNRKRRNPVKKTNFNHKNAALKSNIRSAAVKITTSINYTNFPNHFPKGDEFTVNKTETVLRCIGKVILKGSFQWDAKFLSALVFQLEYEEAKLFLCDSLENRSIFKIIMDSDCISLIVKSNIGCLEYILDSIVNSESVSTEDENRFIEEISLHKDYILNKFLSFGMKYLDTSEEFNSESSTCETASTSSTTEDSISDNLRMDAIKEAIEEYASNTNSDTDMHSDENTVASENEDKAGFDVYYKTVLMLCFNGVDIRIPVYKIREINRFTILYIRLLSYNRILPSEPFIKYFVDIFFEYENCSHLNISLMKMLLKLHEGILRKIKFFEKMYSCIISCISGSMEDIPMCSAFSCLVRIYSKFQDYLNMAYPEHGGIHSHMAKYLKMESATYGERNFYLAEEPEAFQRYAVESMLTHMPYSSIFENEPSFTL
jgi:hypothetical protein